MTQPLDRRLASDVLNDLEDRELPLLAWGVTNGTLSHDEARHVIQERLLKDSDAARDLHVDDVMDHLLRRGLLFRVPGTSPRQYRTRLAETIRLIATLRQHLIFGAHDPDQLRDRWWERGRTLVADYRLHVAPRRYPRRELSVQSVCDQLARLDGWTPLHSSVAAAQIGGYELARFQLEATRSIFGSLQGDEGRGVIVGAGTGSGKTLSFYLPAFADIVAGAQQHRRGIHTLALYPRKELLRDQLREAVSSARALGPALQGTDRRPLRFGALYGDTPKHHHDYQLGSDKTERGRAWGGRRDDLICPFLLCPGKAGGTGEECGEPMVWSAADRAARKERLRCTSCALVVEEVVLTRETLQRQPPDVLFTTTEMLNRSATDDRLGRLMGWGGTIAPRLVLLDEVHTYSGVHGAQVALLLRRWRNDVRGTPTFVGLSATLRDAAAFFAQLTGLRPPSVDYVEPLEKDLQSEGREYALALRADPVSGAGQLSTSIQAAMLMGRVLDPPSQEFLFGSRGFLFTDDLDVTNRFFDDLRDAEGDGSRRGRRGQNKYVLAGLRSPDAAFATARYLAGQSWDLVHRIGRAVLDKYASVGGLRISRTSSQDAGVDRDADLIVATASLEVGFNDPRVGLILQHKTPKDAAAFVQRRGRAGRMRLTRPWTVVSLSDYGRDRLTYQGYETLFAPEIAPRRLPVGNRFVLKIQGTQALLDWLGRKLRSTGNTGDPRALLRSPRGSARLDQGQTTAAKTLIVLLEQLLADSTLQDQLAAHLTRALSISRDEAQALLWEPPRALLLAVVPTALRRLRPGRSPARRDPGAEPGSLLPEFMTTALFDALNVPDVLLRLPFSNEPETLPIEKALREAVPGRVSRRYGHRREDHRTWVALPDDHSGGAIDLATWLPSYAGEGEWQPHGTVTPVAVVRPLEIRLEEPPPEVADRSQGIPIWGTEIVEPTADMYQSDPPSPSAWADRISSVGFATHTAGNPAEVRRIALGAECDTAYANGQSRSSSVRYTLNGEPAGVGFRLTADAMRVGLAPLDLTKTAVQAHLASPAWRTLAFTASVADDPDLDGIANSFQRNWLTLVYLTAFALADLNNPRPSQQIHAALANGTWRSDLSSVFQVLYRDARSGVGHERLIDGLTELSTNPAVSACLDRHGRLLWESDIVDRTADLAQRAYRDTVAAAVHAAAQRACPDAQDNDLIVDVLAAPAPEQPATIWLTETSLGGLGVVEQLVQFYATDPRRFWGLVDTTLGPSDHEYVDATITRLLEHVVADPSSATANAMGRLREARSAAEADTALLDLRAAWADLDGHPRHAAVAALSARLLRPGATATTDASALALVRAWDALQEQLGFEVNAQVIAYAAGAGRLASLGVNTSLSADQAFSVLWPRGSAARTQHLEHYQPYAPKPVLDRLLVRAAHDENLPTVAVTSPNWIDQYTSAVTRRGAAVLVAPTDRADLFGRALRTVPAIAIDQDVLRVYGDVRKTERVDTQLRATVEIREAVQ